MLEGPASMTVRRPSGKSIQQPEGDDSPGIVAALLLLLGIAKLEVSVIVNIPRHGVVDKVVDGDTSGAGTGIRGLRPGAVAPDGVVASLKFGLATVLEGTSMGGALPTRELVSVESVVLTVEAESVVVVVGLHVPAIVDVPNGEVIGSGATEGAEGRDEEDITLPVVPTPLLAAPVVIAVLLAGVVAELVVPIVGHTMMVPSELPEIVPKLPV
jgi:hypothetical protein